MGAGSIRTLVLLRHAKSAWPDDVPDHERPLAPRGLRDAPAAGRWPRDAGYVPDQVLCSTARRARQTWELAELAFGDSPPAVFEHHLYGASAAGLLDVIRYAPPAARAIVVVGHDPAIRDLALALTAAGADSHSALRAALLSADLERMRSKFPTAAIAVLEFSRPWCRLGGGQARLASFVTPREMTGQGQADVPTT
jgi:phosphohistidine phosphatase